MEYNTGEAHMNKQESVLRIGTSTGIGQPVKLRLTFEQRQQIGLATGRYPDHLELSGDALHRALLARTSGDPHVNE